MKIIMAVALAAFAFLPLQASAASAGYTCKGSAAACSKYNNGNYKKYHNKKSAKKRYTTSKRSHQAKKKAKRSAYAGSSKGRHYQTGIASYYWQPQKVASGGYFNPNALTAAHKTLPFGTRVRVTHLRNGRSVVVRINDRGPYIKGRIIDLSKRAAGVIGMQGSGIARVRVDILGKS
ncbi:MAG: septal ring lytic transglycosylase RlpA family protein [Pseudomonadota bacterium]